MLLCLFNSMPGPSVPCIVASGFVISHLGRMLLFYHRVKIKQCFKLCASFNYDVLTQKSFWLAPSQKSNNNKFISHSTFRTFFVHCTGNIILWHLLCLFFGEMLCMWWQGLQLQSVPFPEEASTCRAPKKSPKGSSIGS